MSDSGVERSPYEDPPKLEAIPQLEILPSDEHKDPSQLEALQEMQVATHRVWSRVPRRGTQVKNAVFC